MSYFFTVVASMAVGLLLGLASVLLFEPWKKEREEERLAKIATTALYHELGWVMELLHYATSTNTRIGVIHTLDFPDFDYYYNHHREIMYRVPCWRELVSLVRELRGKHRWLTDKQTEPRTVACGMIESFSRITNVDLNFGKLLGTGRTHAIESLKTIHADFARWQQELETNRL